jgi:hypothetical protein
LIDWKVKNNQSPGLGVGMYLFVHSDQVNDIHITDSHDLRDPVDRKVKNRQGPGLVKNVYIKGTLLDSTPNFSLPQTSSHLVHHTTH